MAEESFDPNPLSEQDLAPIEPLTPKKILNIGQKYKEASIKHTRLGKRIQESTGILDHSVLEEFHYQAGRLNALKEVLEELGQGKLVSTTDTTNT